MKVDVIIPTYNPDEKLTLLLGNLERQTMTPHRIFILNTIDKDFDVDDFNAKYKTEENIEIRHIGREEFDHGTTRNNGANLSEADYILFITQDAVPTDNKLIENMAKSMGPNVVSAYARQVSNEDNPIEMLARRFNYPPVSSVKSESDKERLGIKVIFCSNVCAMYNHDVFDKLGGFATNNIFNEDMLYAYKVIKSGYSIAYVAESSVMHTHYYSLKKIFQRYFDQGVSQKNNSKVFSEFSTMSEGGKQAKYIVNGLIKAKNYSKVLLFILQSAAKVSGLLLGKNYSILPKSLRQNFSMNKNYWHKQ